MKPRAPPPVLLILLCLTGCSGEERDEVTADATQATVGTADAYPPADSYDSIFAAAEQVYFAGEYDSAQIVLERTRVRARQDGEAAVEARALTWIGLAHWRLGDHVSAARVGRGMARQRRSRRARTRKKTGQAKRRGCRRCRSVSSRRVPVWRSIFHSA